MNSKKSLSSLAAALSLIALTSESETAQAQTSLKKGLAPKQIPLNTTQKEMSQKGLVLPKGGILFRANGQIQNLNNAMNIGNTPTNAAPTNTLEKVPLNSSQKALSEKGMVLPKGGILFRANGQEQNLNNAMQVGEPYDAQEHKQEQIEENIQQSGSEGSSAY